MRKSSEEELLRYYGEELTYLRERGREFSRTHPKVAHRLELTDEGSDEGSRDPHVERLIESFAFLTARIRRNLDQESPEIASALLETLYPGYLAPVPSTTVAEFLHDPKQGKLTSGYTIPRDTALVAESGSGERVQFRTCYPVTLWPFEVSSVRFEADGAYEFLDRRPDVSSVLRIELQSTQGDLGTVALNDLRFYLGGPLAGAGSLYELLFTHACGVSVLTENGTIHSCGRNGLQPVGFAEEEHVLPGAPTNQPAFHLIREYFVCPRKFHFFDVCGLPERISGTRFSILVMLDYIPPDILNPGPESIRLSCAPAVNLFSRNSEPLRLDHRKTEYRVEPDVRHQTSTEIHSIREISRVDHATVRSVPVRRLFSFNHAAAEDAPTSFWYARHIATGRKDRPGTDTVVRFVDLNFDPQLPTADTIFARVECTNRHLANELPAGALLQLESGGPVRAVRALHKPTPQEDPPLSGPALWRLISHLNVSRVSLHGGAGGVNALREILMLYSPPGSASAQRQIGGVRDMQTRSVVRRLGSDAWRGLARGTEVRLTLDAEAFAGTNVHVFSTVLRYFFGLFSHVNSFTRVVVEDARNGEETASWPPLAGAQELL
jgi:type VI secretion system protein ImpG